ncbi:hypothetical protein PAPYR_4713 [Paratrimastix pyriformis]|uniref:Uncharacterized protein n=1 Tax=Paratrimastix pyriformis TaxID=342808 RepID=A0ABQ8UN24_9EUKA|nr:hypothetical protein PAPYR_4713 [Paratrimastix pyriformis]
MEGLTENGATVTRPLFLPDSLQVSPSPRQVKGNFSLSAYFGEFKHDLRLWDSGGDSPRGWVDHPDLILACFSVIRGHQLEALHDQPGNRIEVNTNASSWSRSVSHCDWRTCVIKNTADTGIRWQVVSHALWSVPPHYFSTGITCPPWSVPPHTIQRHSFTWLTPNHHHPGDIHTPGDIHNHPGDTPVISTTTPVIQLYC